MKSPGLHAGVRLAVYDQQSFETRSAALPAVGYFTCLLVSPLAKEVESGWVCYRLDEGRQYYGMSSSQ